MKKTLLYTFSAFILICCLCVFVFVNTKETVAVIGAMDDEISEIYNNLKNPKTVQINDFKITTGNIGNRKIVLSKCGIGKVASASTTQFIIDKYKPKFIITTGIAGSLSEEIKAGDIIIAEKMIQHDFDVTAFGCAKGHIDNGVEPNKPTLFLSDKALIKTFKENAEAIKDTTVIVGTIATGDVFVNKEVQKNQIKKEFNADAVDMESASIAQTAKRNNIPVITLKTISDSENNSTAEYKQNKKLSAHKSASVILSVLK